MPAQDQPNSLEENPPIAMQNSEHVPYVGVAALLVLLLAFATFTSGPVTIPRLSKNPHFRSFQLSCLRATLVVGPLLATLPFQLKQVLADRFLDEQTRFLTQARSGTVLLVAIIVGFASDRKGRRIFATSLSALLAIALFALAVSYNYQLLVLLNIILGFATTVVPIVETWIVRQHRLQDFDLTWIYHHFALITFGSFILAGTIVLGAALLTGTLFVTFTGSSLSRSVHMISALFAGVFALATRSWPENTRDTPKIGFRNISSARMVCKTPGLGYTLVVQGCTEAALLFFFALFVNPVAPELIVLALCGACGSCTYFSLISGSDVKGMLTGSSIMLFAATLLYFLPSSRWYAIILSCFGGTISLISLCSLRARLSPQTHAGSIAGLMMMLSRCFFVFCLLLVKAQQQQLLFVFCAGALFTSLILNQTDGNEQN